MTPHEPCFPKSVLRRQNLARFTAARLGGPADFLYIAKNPNYHDTLEIIRQAWEQALPVTIIGGGANILISDKGVRGLCIINRATRISHQIDGNEALVTASSGANLIRLVRYCQEHGFAGLEWAIAVPGTVGGALVNNAGAHDGDMTRALESALVYEAAEGERRYRVDELDYNYRFSLLKARADKQFFVMDAVFRLIREDPNTILDRMEQFSAYRKRTQPPGASLGSIFKNPTGDYAGRLIEAVSLKGYRIGDVRVSPIHANFFVNHGAAASASDYFALIQHVRAVVLKRFGIELELEIQTLGEWG